KLTKEQKAKLDKPAAEDGREMGMFLRELSRIPAEVRAKKAGEFRGVQEKKIAEVLDVEQQRRLGQILLQQQGYSALASQDVADLLKLSAEQRGLVEAVLKEFSPTRRFAFFGGNRNGQERIAELRQKESEKLAALLTEAQKAQ